MKAFADQAKAAGLVTSFWFNCHPGEERLFYSSAMAFDNILVSDHFCPERYNQLFPSCRVYPFSYGVNEKLFNPAPESWRVHRVL